MVFESGNVEMDEAARQLMRAIRGPRSQVAFSRKLGYRGNVAAKWEGGHRFPTFGEMLRACLASRIEVAEALKRFHEASADEWDSAEPTAIHRWLCALQGRTTQALLAERAGLSRQQVGRLLSGRAQGRLPQVLALLQAMTGRMPDLIGALVDIEQVPAVSAQVQARRALARLAFSHPWSPAARAWLGAQKRVPMAEAALRLSRTLGLPESEAEALIEALVTAEAATVVRGTLRPAERASVEIRPTADDIQRLRAHWARVTADRVERASGDDLYSFNVFAVSRADLERIREAQRRFYREVRAIVAESPPEVPALLSIHTAVWDS